MTRSLVDNPAIAVPLILLFFFCLLYFNRCPRCKKWFTLRRHTRKGAQHGDSRAKTAGWSCTSCGARARDITGLAEIPLPPENPTVVTDGAAIPSGPFWHPRSLWGRFRWKGLFGAIAGAFMVAFVAFDPEVLSYPSHLPSYLEAFADVLLMQSSEHRKLRTRVRVIGGSWKKTRTIEKCMEVVEEGWLQKIPPGAIVIERSPRGWKPELARQGLTFEMAPVWAKYRRLVWGRDSEVTREGRDGNPLTPELVLPPVIEMGIGTKRPGPVTGEYFIEFQEVGGEETFRVDSVMLRRISDREHRLCGISEEVYRALRLATDSWNARITVYSFGGEPDVRLYVDDLFAAPFN